jgi:hypothetical protein
MEDYFTYACRKAETETGSEKIAWEQEVQRMTDWLNKDRLVESIEDEIREPSELSYFEVMCWKAENSLELAEKAEAQREADRIVKIMNTRSAIDTSLPKSSGNASNPVYGSGPSAGVGVGGGSGGLATPGQAVIGQIATNLSGAVPQYAYAVMNTNLTSAQLMSGSVNVRHEVQSDSAELPPQVLYTEDDSGNQIRMTLAPEYSISTHEALQLMLLLQATATNPRAFSAYRFVKSKNLERHFKFETC